MKILFEFSRGGLKEHRSAFELLRASIVAGGHVLTNDLVQDSTPNPDVLPDDIYSRLRKAVVEADCIIIEGSVVSLSLGFVLTEAIHAGKPVLFLIHANSLTQRNRFISSIRSKLVTYKNYRTDEELTSFLRTFLRHHNYIKTRFNLVLSNELNSYITIHSREKNISKTEYITQILEEYRRKQG